MSMNANPDMARNTPGTPPGDAAATKSEVQAKQATDKPKGMPVVLIVSTVAAAVAMWVIWSVFFA